MADTMGHSPDRAASTIRNSTAAIAILVLALAPQIVDLVYSTAGLIFRFSGARDPAQALYDHVFGLLWAMPSLASGFGGGSKVALPPSVLLALIYSYPLLAIAVLSYFIRPRAPQDYFGGVVLIAIALFALWASSDLQGMRGFSFGAGTAPRMFGVLLLVLGAGVGVIGLLTDGPQFATYHWRGPLFVSLAILSFAVAIRPMGVIFSAFTSFIISALGTPETKWKETIIVGICLTTFCSLLFPYALGLPLQMWPKFLIR